MVSRLDRRTARPRAAEMVVGRTLGPARTAGRYRPLPADGSAGETAARSACKAAPRAAQMMRWGKPASTEVGRSSRLPRANTSKIESRGFSWRRNTDSIFATESGGWNGQAVQHGFARAG